MAGPQGIGTLIVTATPSTNFLKSLAHPRPSIGTVAIEQAIFTSARTDRKDGYQLVAWSPGIAAEDARELAVWGPAHDSMIADNPADVSVNFHPLGKSRYCISRTMLGQPEYSGRGGRQVYTHCLVLDRAGFLKLHNDPFRVLSAALASCNLRPGSSLPLELPTLNLFPSGPAVEVASIEYAQDSSVQLKMVNWMHHVLTHQRIYLTGSYTEQFLAAFINLLPVASRAAFSFSTRLRYSPRREFRIVGLASDVEEHKKASRQAGLVPFSFERNNRSQETSRHPWATWTQIALCQKDAPRVANMIAEAESRFRTHDLSELGHKLHLASSFGKTASLPPHEPPTDNATEPWRRMIDLALEGDLTSLDQFHTSWETLEGQLQKALREDCLRYLDVQALRTEDRRDAVGDSAVEILRLILAD